MITINANKPNAMTAGLPLSIFNFRVSAAERLEVVAPGSVTPYTADDRNMEVQTGAVVDHEADIAVEPLAGDPLPTLESLDESVAIVDANGRVTRVGDGTVGILARTRQLVRRIDLDICHEDPGDADVFIEYVAGGMARGCVDQIDTRLAAADPATGMALFTTLNHTTQTYIRNPQCWASDLDLTGIAVWDSRHGTRGGIATIAADCAIGCEHYPLQVGDRIRWVTADGIVVERTIAAKVNIGPANSSDACATDWQLMLLDSDLPASIKPLKVLPADWPDYLPSLSMSYRLPVLMLDQQQHGRVADLYDIGTFGAVTSNLSALRANYWESTVDGDSGYQACLVIDGQAVLVHTFTWANSRGPALSANIATINAAMTNLGSAYQLTDIDLSGFPTY